MAKAKKEKATAPKKPRAKRKKKNEADPGTRGLTVDEMAAPAAPDRVAAIEKLGGRVLLRYREPLGGTFVLLAAIPIGEVAATPFQRDLSDTHVGKLTAVIGKVGRFLDPIIAVLEDGKLWTPNGHHRLAAMRRLGAKAITTLIVEDEQIAYQILALNTEKAHNLRERCLEVIRMYRDLAQKQPQRRESDFALEFDEASLATLGICYEERPRFAGGAYHSMVKRIDTLADRSLADCLPIREARAKLMLELDDQVAAIVEKLRGRGLVSPYLKNFVIARLNPIRFVKGEVKQSFEEVLAKAQASAAKFDAEKVKPGDLATAAGPPDEAG